MVNLTPAARTKLDAYLDAYATPGHPGTMVGLTNKQGDVIYYRSVGGDVTGKPYGEDTVWWIASCTKLITSIAAMQLVEAGQIGLDDPLADVLPELKAVEMIVESSPEIKLAKSKLVNTVPQADDSTPITLRMLLTHTAGFAYPWYNADLLNWVRQNGPNAYDEQLKYPLVHEPGSTFDYSVCLDWAGKVVEAISGLSLEEYGKKHIFEPLEMRDTTWRIDQRPDMQERLAVLHGWNDEMEFAPRDWPGLLDPKTEWGGAAITCTGKDYLKILAVLLNRGVGSNGTRILKQETIALMLTDQTAHLPNRGALELNGSAPTVDTSIAAGDLTLLPGQRKGWGLCSLLNLDDVPGNRKAGTAEWGGVANLMWIADRASEVGIIVFNQALPYGFPKFIETMGVVQGAVYDNGLE